MTGRLKVASCALHGNTWDEDAWGRLGGRVWAGGERVELRGGGTGEARQKSKNHQL